mgnify:CR=1 FL=1
MSNYLETLVEKMVADGVSEQDIKSVIKEVNKNKTPFNQVSTSSSTLPSPDTGITTGQTSTATNVTPQSTSGAIPTESQEMTDEECVRINGEGYCVYNGQCYRCDAIPTDGEQQSQSQPTDIVDVEPIDDSYLDEGTSEETEEPIAPLYDESISSEENVINIQEQINPETQDLFTAEEAYNEIRVSEGLINVEEQNYNPDPNVVDRTESYSKAENVNNAQFVEENLESNSMLDSVSDKMLEDNGDFTLWKTNFTDNNGEEKVAVFPNAMANNTLGNEGVGATDGFYYTDKKSAWEHMAKNSNYLLFDSQEEADSFIKLTTGENGYTGFVPPWEYDASSSNASVNILRTPTKNEIKCSKKEGLLEELKCIYFETSRADKKLYPTFELFYNASIDHINKSKEWNPKESYGQKLMYAQWLLSKKPPLKDNEFNRASYENYVLTDSPAATNIKVIEANTKQIQKFKAESILTFSNTKMSHVAKGRENSVGTYFVSDKEGSRNLLKYIDREIWLNNEKVYNDIHEYIFTFLPKLKKQGYITYDEEDMKDWFYSLTPGSADNPRDFIEFTATDFIPGLFNDEAGGWGWQAMMKGMEYVLDYKQLQAEELGKVYESFYNNIMEGKNNTWVDLDENGNLVEVKVSGNRIIEDLKNSEFLNEKISILNTIQQSVTTNNKLLQPAVEKLNEEIKDLEARLLLEMETFEIPGYENASDSEKAILEIKSVQQVQAEASRVTALFIKERDKLIKKYENENKELLKKEKDLKSEIELIKGDNAKKTNDQIRLYLARINQYQASGIQDVLEKLDNTFGVLFEEDLPKSFENRQNQLIQNKEKHKTAINVKWENMGFFGDFLKNTFLGSTAFKSFEFALTPIGGLNPYSSDSFEYIVAIDRNSAIYNLPLNSDYGYVMMDRGEVTYNGVTYLVYSSKNKLQGFYIKEEGETDKSGQWESTKAYTISDMRNPDHLEAQKYIIEQLEFGTVDLTTDFSFKGLSSTIAAEAMKMGAIAYITRGIGVKFAFSRSLAFWMQGGFQGIAYGYQSYTQSVEHYLKENKYQKNTGNAELYGLMNGVLTALIAQFNVEGRIGGGGFSEKVVADLVKKFVSGQVVGMTKKAAIKFMAKEIGKMIIGETVEEWAEALISEWLGGVWDTWKNEGGGIDMGQGVKHNDVFVDMTARDFLEMQIIVIGTAGVMGGSQARSRIKSVKDANVGEMYGHLQQILKDDPTLESMRQNLELSKDEMTEEQYNNVNDFINDVVAFWNNDVSSKKFNYTDIEKGELLKALVLKKDAERAIKEEENKKKNKEEDDSEALVQLKIEKDVYTELIEDIKEGRFFSEGHGGTTRNFRIKFNKYLSNKFPGLDHEAIKEKVSDLIALESNPDFKETNPKEYKLLKEIRSRQKQLIKEMDKELGDKAKQMAIDDNRDPLDKGVLNRYKQLLIVNEDHENDILLETRTHNQQKENNIVEFNKLLQRTSDKVDKNTTDKQWQEIIDACVTDRQIRLVNSMRNKISASPDITVNLYWSGGSGVKGQSGKNSYNYNTTKSHLNGGRIDGSTIDINMEHAKSNVVDHEATHHWFDNLENSNPKAHKKMKDTLIEYIKRNPNLIGYVRFGERYKYIQENTVRQKINGVLETEAEFQARVDATITDEMIVEFLADVISGKQPLGEVVKKGVLNTLLSMFKSNSKISEDVASMDFDQIINLVADICDGYSKGKVKNKHKALINADNLTVDGSNTNKHQSINTSGKRSYIVYDANNSPIDVGAEINRLYKTDKSGAVDMSSKTFQKIKSLIDLVLENESRKSRKDKGSFEDTPGFDLEAFKMAAMYGSSNKSYEYILQTMMKFDPLVNDDFFGFIMTKGNKQGVFLPQMLDGLKSGDVTNDFFFESIDHEDSVILNKWGPEGDYSSLDEVQLPGEDVLDPSLIVNEVDNFDATTSDENVRLIDAIDLNKEVMIKQESVDFKSLLNKIILRIAGTKLPAYDEEVSSNRLKSHPFTTAIFQQAGDISGTLRLAVQSLMGKGGDAYKNFLVENKGLLIENLTATYLSKNIPNAVEKFVVGIGWTTDWKGKKIARYTKEDGPAWAGVTSGPLKIRTVKLQEGQTWNDIISDDAFVAIYMNLNNGKYTRIQGKGEGLEYQIAGEMGLQTFLDGLKDKTSDISTRFKAVSGLSDIIITDQSIVNIENTMRRGGDKEAINIINITQDPSKYDGVFNNLINIGNAITNLGNLKTDEKQVIKIVEDILKPIIDPDNEGQPLFTKSERGRIAKDIFKLVEKYNTSSKNLGEGVTLPMFVNKLLTNKALTASFVKKYKILDQNDKPIVISKSFDDINKVMTQRQIPLQMVNEMIADGTMSKYDAVKYLLKHYKAQYTSMGKIGRGGMIVYDKKTKTLKVISGAKIKGNIQRYQVFQNVDDFVDNVVNKIGGDNSVKVNSNGVGTIDGQPVEIDTSPATQTVKARRAVGYDENLKMALESRKALMLQLNWLAEKIKDKDSGYTKEDYIMLLMSLKSNMNSVLRASANLKYDIGADYKGKVRYEHMIPAEIVCQILADKHLNPDTKITDEMLDQFFENYNVAIISTEMDDMLKTFDLVSSMPISWSPGNSALIRYYNELTNGHKDLHPITNLQDNTVVGKESIATSDALDIVQIKSDANEIKIKSDTDLTLNNVEVINSKESIDALNKKLFNPNTIRFFDFDETLTIGGENLVYATSPDGKREPIPSDEFVTRVSELTEAGYTFDFSDFVNVRGGEDGPMLQKLINQINRYGTDNIRILTARQPQAALAIFEWLKTKGINLPLANIKGLGVDGKTIRGVDKAIELETYIANGYTDIEMYDDSKDVVDAINNLKDKYDVKIEGILAVENFKESINVINSKFLEILEQKVDIDPLNLPTALEAQIEAAKKWNFSLFPPGSYAFRDFLYRFLPKGKEGEDALLWLDEMLTKPYNKGVADFKSAKIKLAKRYKDLIKSLPTINKNLNNNVPNSTFTYDHAVRVYVWSKNKYNIPDITPEEASMLIAIVEADPELKAFADGLNSISLKQYTKPTNTWVSGSVASDISNISNEFRGKFLTEWKENVDLMFTEEVRNTLLKVYGNKFMTAFDDMLFAMEYGTGRQNSDDQTTSRFRQWINNSVGAIMFLNMRSATLQTISAFNFIDWKNNNMVKAAKAFANQKQFWSDFTFLWNSDYVQSRLGDDARGVTEAEINKAIKGKGNKVNAIISYLLKLGFTPTKLADAFAICSGGSAFYRNQTKFYQEQTNPLTEELFTLEEAQAQAYLDFQAKAEESQQSADPSQISQIQRSNLGILLLSFKNTPMQYARIMLRAASDIKNNRGSKSENLGKIAYYGMLQSALFVFLQQAVWAKLGDEEEEEATDSMIKSMIDNILSGLGLTGNIIVTVKNGVIEYVDQEQKGWNADHTYTILEFLNLSPSIGSKFRKLYSSIKTRQINRDVMEEMGLEPGNPAIDAVANLISAFTNIPVDRAVRKVNNILLASSNEYEVYDRIALLLGWNAWDLGLETEANIIRNRLREEKKTKKEKDKENKQKEKTKEIISPVIKKEVEQYEKDVKDGKIVLDEEGYPKDKKYVCAGVNSKAKRCGAEVKKPGDKCQWHKDEDKDGVPDYKQEDANFIKTQCEFIKPNNERCKNNATGGNGRCNVKQHGIGYKK